MSNNPLEIKLSPRSATLTQSRVSCDIWARCVISARCRLLSCHAQTSAFFCSPAVTPGTPGCSRRIALQPHHLHAACCDANALFAENRGPARSDKNPATRWYTCIQPACANLKRPAALHGSCRKVFFECGVWASRGRGELRVGELLRSLTGKHEFVAESADHLVRFNVCKAIISFIHERFLKQMKSYY